MKVTYRTTRKEVGLLGKTKFFVEIKVTTISSEEKSILDEFGAYTGFEISDRFEDVKGVSKFMGLRDFQSEAMFQFDAIQPASDFVSEVLSGLEKVKEQIERTRVGAAGLDKEFTREL